jgi:streptogramin lyase
MTRKMSRIAAIPILSILFGQPAVWSTPAMSEYPVTPGDHPHDVAPARDGTV